MPRALCGSPAGLEIPGRFTVPEQTARGVYLLRRGMNAACSMRKPFGLDHKRRFSVLAPTAHGVYPRAIIISPYVSFSKFLPARKSETATRKGCLFASFLTFKMHTDF